MTRRGPGLRHRRPARLRACGHPHQEGQSLVIAVAFLLIVGLIVVTLLGFAQTNVKGVSAYRTQRSIRYAADAAIEQGIQWARTRPNVGVDSAGADTCNLKVPSTGAGVPDLSVTCAAPSGSGSGLPTGTGKTPKYAILTLGQRDTEPPSFNGPTCLFEGPWKGYDTLHLLKSNLTEYGIRFSATRNVACALQQRAVSSWQVSGNVYSNSRIEGGGANIETVDGGTVSAVGGCGGGVSGCTTVARAGHPDPYVASSTDANGGDPRINCSVAADCASWNLPDLSGLKHQSVPDASNCGAGKVITFEPGYYDDIDGLNSLFKNGNCKATIFWFAPAKGPGPDGTLGTSDDEQLGTGYKQGLYYFDFRGTDSTGGCNYYSASASTNHQWCVGMTYDSNQVVVGGTPLGWNPVVGAGSSPSNPAITMNPTSVDGLGTSPFWSNQSNAVKGSAASSINGQSASYNNGVVAVDRPITVQGFTPKVPSGGFTGSVNLRVAHSEGSEFNAPKVSVSYDSSLFGAKSCGTYNLHRGTYGAASPDELSATDQTLLGQCLNQGDKLNSVKVKYTVSGCTFICSSPSLDGIELVTGTQPQQPTFPRPATGTDPGGDCDDSKPGVQFIFGGDSHLYVADGSVELCAGPAAQNTSGSQQIAVYGVPALTPLRPDASPTRTGSDATGSANLDNAKRIAEPTGPDRGLSATVTYNGSNCGFCTKTVEGGVSMHFPAVSLPAGSQVTKVTARASYNSHGPISEPQLQLPCGGRQSFSASGLIDTGTSQEQRTLSSCMNSIVTQAGGFNATWWMRGTKVCGFGICNGPFTDDLDGVEFIVEVGPTSGGTDGPKPMPNQGCITAAPNYWNTAQGGEADCALIKVDQTKNPLSPSQSSRGRLSVKGTIYAPAAAIDVDDEDVLYPFFDRGLVARTLMLRGFKYRSNKVPVGSAPKPDLSVAAREIVFSVCKRGAGRTAVTTACDASQGDRIYARARVRYEIDRTPRDPNSAYTDCTTSSGASLVWSQCWARVPKVQWYSADR